MLLTVTTTQILEAILDVLQTRVTSTTDIRELNYQGIQGTLPAIRFAAEFRANECKGYDVTLAVYCWSEKDSSKEAQQLADEVTEAMHLWSQSATTKAKFSGIHQTRIPQVIRDQRTWRAEVWFELKAC